MNLAASAIQGLQESPTRGVSAWAERWAPVGLSALQRLTESLAALTEALWGNGRGASMVGAAPAIRCGEADDRAPADACGAATPEDWGEVCLSRKGDHEAYARLVRRYQEPIAAYMWRFTRDRRQWEELVHDVFVEAYFSLAGYAGRAPLVHWLKRIATRVGYRWWKSRRSRGRELSLSSCGEAWSSPASQADAARDAATLVHRLLAELAPRDRLVMTLLYLESNSVAEVAGLTGWTQTMVKVQAYRARKRLAKICARWGIEL